jgi:hypothetical protein
MESEDAILALCSLMPQLAPILSQTNPLHALSFIREFLVILFPSTGWGRGISVKVNKHKGKKIKKTKLRGVSPRANYTDPATAACRQR